MINTAGGPRRTNCDVIMKGGITSGVVYPKLLTELAQRYDLKNIGGTSAGAIAAALAAAAQYRRAHDHREPDAGFDLLGGLANELAADRLTDLFQPTDKTKLLHTVVTSVLRANGALSQLAAALRALFVGAAEVTLPLCLVALAFTIYLLLEVSIASALLASTTGLVAVFVAMTVCLYRSIVDLRDEGYGICSGLSSPDVSPEKSALTNWLNERMNYAAGIDPNGPPLTFGDLWNIAAYPNAADEPRARQINLEMMTTNLTAGRPYRLPALDDSFVYDRNEFAALFPPSVMRYLDDLSTKRPFPNGQFAFFPSPADLPVIVAVRLTLSFPILLQAVPLYTADKQTRCWFSDGGICSNFPVHFFDAILPNWPTFAINLRDYDPAKTHLEGARAEKLVWLPTGPTDFSEDPFATNSITSVTSFLGTIFSTAQNWNDNAQSRLPGYHERIVQISLRKNEGGLNLFMPPKVVTDLAGRGAEAGRKFRSFAWEQHRLARYRLAGAHFGEKLSNARFGFRRGGQNDSSFFDFLRSIANSAHADCAWVRDALPTTRSVILLSERRSRPFRPAANRRVDLRITPRL